MTQQNKPLQLEIFPDGAKAKKDATPYSEAKEFLPEFKFPTQICIKVACLLIVILISFALGVERGKLISQKKVSTRFLAENKASEIVKEISINAESIPPATLEKQNEPAEKTNIEKVKEENTVITSGYIIQVASYKKNSSFIEKEIEKLKKSGYNTMTVSSGEYMGICAGGFSDKDEAQKYLKDLQKTYKDCFIRKI